MWCQNQNNWRDQVHRGGGTSRNAGSYYNPRRSNRGGQTRQRGRGRGTFRQTRATFMRGRGRGRNNEYRNIKYTKQQIRPDIMDSTNNAIDTNLMYVIGRNEYGEFGLKHKQKVKHLTNIATININTVVCGHQYNIYSDGNNNFWAAGDNYSGQCGINDNTRNLKTLTPITYFKKNNIKISKVFVGVCTLWISDKDQLYVNGSNLKYQLGINNKCEIVKPTLVNNIPNMKCIVYGASAQTYSIILCSINVHMIIQYYLRIYLTKLMSYDVSNLMELFYGNPNTVYSTGYSQYGGNGQGVWSGVISKWCRINSFKHNKIIAIATGLEHSLFLETNGTVWCCGENAYGQLGLTHNQNVNIPVKILYFVNKGIKIKYIECGAYHNLVISSDDNVYVFGRNGCGQCGDGTRRNIATPKLLSIFNVGQIKTVKCGSYHSYICTKNGMHYLFGYNGSKECLYSTNMYKVTVPRVINQEIQLRTNGKAIKDVYLGHYNTMFSFREKN